MRQRRLITPMKGRAISRYASSQPGQNSQSMPPIAPPSRTGCITIWMPCTGPSAYARKAEA